jgi:hypothetical protein
MRRLGRNSPREPCPSPPCPAVIYCTVITPPRSFMEINLGIAHTTYLSRACCGRTAATLPVWARGKQPTFNRQNLRQNTIAPLPTTSPSPPCPAVIYCTVITPPRSFMEINLGIAHTRRPLYPFGHEVNNPLSTDKTSDKTLSPLSMQ